MRNRDLSVKKENTIMKRLFTFLLIAVLGLAFTAAPAQRRATSEETKQLQPSKDATLIESPSGDLANSEGQTIFVGRTGQPQYSMRRGLIAFDLAAIPHRSRILSVTLTMTVQLSANGDQPTTVNLYRVLRFWKEGTSVSQGGRGAKAEPGDATWIHSVYPSSRWARPGGDYIRISSAKTAVAAAGSYTWISTPRLVADVQSWVNSPKKNFGWILIGDESKAPTAKVFHSRESTDESVRPKLTVTFRPPAR